MRFKQLVCLLGLAGISTASLAAVITINTTYDLTAGFSNIVPLSGGPVSIANGDHVVLNVDFLGNQTLTIGDSGSSEQLFAWLAAGDNNSTFTINNSQIDLLGFSSIGGAAPSYNLGTVSSGAAHIGPLLNDFLTAGQSVTFSGYRATYDVQSIAVSPHQYASLWFRAAGNNLSVGTAPEPTTLALLGLGLAGLAASRRRKQ